MSNKWYPSYNNEFIQMTKFFNATNALFQDIYLGLKLKEQYLKKVPDMSRQQVKVSGPNGKS